MTNLIKALFTLTFTFSLNTLATPNSIIAIVNDELITFDAISDEIKPSFTRAQKIELVDNQIDLMLQLEKIKKIRHQTKAKLS